jgi:hypothetical protein
MRRLTHSPRAMPRVQAVCPKRVTTGSVSTSISLAEPLPELLGLPRFFKAGPARFWQAGAAEADPNATVYQLEPNVAGGFLSFAKVDENILLVIDREGNPLVGNANFSYTLNRIVRSGSPEAAASERQ